MKDITQLRDWQIQAVNSGRHAQHFLCQAPGGSGKSLVQVMLAQADINDTGNKQLILVPQSHIHRSFYDEDGISFTLPGDQDRSHWKVAHNLCSNNRGTLATLKKFLLADSAELRSRNASAAVCTHQALGLLWRRFTDDERRQALQCICHAWSSRGVGE